MPKGRMLSKKISYDEKIAKLSIPAALLYTWCIPHLDVEGRIYGAPEIIKGTVVPYVKEIKLEKIPILQQEMVDADLIILYGNNHKYMEFKGFHNNQTINKDREAPSEIPTPDKLLTDSYKTPAKVNISKVNISKDILSGKPDLEAPILYLNTKTQKNFDPKNRSNQEFVRARYAEGRTIDDFKKVIDKKVTQWHTDEKMAKYLRPATLFNCTNFESYLNEVEPKPMSLLDKYAVKK